MIINQTGGGTQPTGTTQITSNGTHNVAGYEFADVNVPTTAPALYREFELDGTGKLVQNTTTTHIMDFTGMKDVNAYMLTYAYYNNTAISGAVDMSDLTKVSGMYACNYMFQGCTGLTSVDLSSLETVSGGNACQSMFKGCTGLTSIDLSSLKTVSYSSGCNSMFYGCTGITSIDLSSLTTISGGNACQEMFNGCTGLTSADLSSLTTVNGQGGCNGMFYGCTGITSIDLSSLTILSGQNGCNGMFFGCTNLASVNISHLTKIGTTSVSSNMSGMFKNCTSLTSLSFNGLPYTTINLNGAFQNMLQGVTGCTVHFPADWQTDMSSWSNVTNGFGGTNTTVLWDLPSVTTLDLNYAKDVIESDIVIFDSFSKNNYFPNITKFDIKDIETIQCAQFGQTFSGCTALTSIDLSGLKSITGSGSSSSSAFGHAFDGCTGLTGTINLSSLETIGQGYACYYMFNNCTGITSVDLSGLTTISSGSACQGMFQGCTALTSVDLSGLTTISSGSGACTNMFNGCTSLATVYIGGTTAIYFGTNTSQFNNMFINCTQNIDVYAPAANQAKIASFSGYPNFGGTGTVTWHWRS